LLLTPGYLISLEKFLGEMMAESKVFNKIFSGSSLALLNGFIYLFVY
jgi:hypothetical protein